MYIIFNFTVDVFESTHPVTVLGARESRMVIKRPRITKY